jgi:hypothetical protein
MTEIPISPEIWKLASEILTVPQLTVLELRERHGFSWHQIAVYTNRTKTTVRGHYDAATKNIFDELDRRRVSACEKEDQNGSTPKEGNPPTAKPRPLSGSTDRDPAHRLAHHPRPSEA